VIQRGLDGNDPVRAEPVGPVVQEERRRARSSHVASGTLACPTCDAPVALARPMSPADAIACGYCDHAGAVRDFLSLASPTRPAHVNVRIAGRPATA
jgi:hypothetical protein